MRSVIDSEKEPVLAAGWCNSLFIVLFLFVGLIACSTSRGQSDAATSAPVADDSVALAINFGGDAYFSSDGIQYQSDRGFSGTQRGKIKTIKGSQDPALYQTYRRGELQDSFNIENGVYDLTLHFAEPADLKQGERVFDIQIEGRRVVAGVDVMLFRDGKIHSGLTITVPNVTVRDEQLSLGLIGVKGEAVISALVARRKKQRSTAWQLVWQDEFEDSGRPDDSKWNVENWPARKVNDEDQAYTDRPRNIRVLNGHLVIEAHKENYNGAKYTSARLQSQGKSDFLYGRFEIRAKLPSGQGTWPAIWMLPSNPLTYATRCSDANDWQGNPDCDAWPNSGEIDIMEHVGYQMNHVHGTVHTEAYYWLKWEQRKGRVILDNVADNFHVYALEWTPDRIDIFVDDTLYFTYMNEGAGWRAWPFDHPFHLILNIAVGGAWGRAGGPIDDSIFPQRMLVDYVRVYRAIDD